jgi:hypothetical protein
MQQGTHHTDSARERIAKSQQRRRALEKSALTVASAALTFKSAPTDANRDALEFAVYQHEQLKSDAPVSDVIFKTLVQAQVGTGSLADAIESVEKAVGSEGIERFDHSRAKEQEIAKSAPRPKINYGPFSNPHKEDA